MKVEIPTGKKVYFASDFHLGAPNPDESIRREKRLVKWMDTIMKDASHLFLLGDVFDFWFEYKKVIPKGFIRFQGKLAELSDNGVEIHFFPGNHDMWMFNYFQSEMGIKISHQPMTLEINRKLFHIGHGDGLGPGDKSYKLLLNIFKNPLCQWLFRMLPPVIGIGFAHKWSRGSRINNMKKGEDFKGEDKEYLYQYCVQMENKNHHDYYIFGHRHLELDMKVGSKSRYINLGEWVNGSTYVVFDGSELKINQVAT